MPLEARDAASLWDVLQAVQAITAFTTGVPLEDYRSSPMLRRAVERELEVVGEAARRLSDAFRTSHPEVRWRRIISLRNLIAHSYDAVDDERVWRLAVQDVPQLVDQLRALLPPEPAD